MSEQAKPRSPGVPAHSSVPSTDPVCGMTVATRPAVHVAEYEGHTYHFCCAGCRERFAADPQSFLEVTP